MYYTPYWPVWFGSSATSRSLLWSGCVEAYRPSAWPGTTLWERAAPLHWPFYSLLGLSPLIENTSLKAAFFSSGIFFSPPSISVLGFCSKQHVSTFYNLPFAHTQTSLNDQVTYRSVIYYIIAVVVFQTILSYSRVSILRPSHKEKKIKPEWPLKRSDPRVSSLWKSDCEGKHFKDRWSLGLVFTEIQGWSLGLVFGEI